MLNVHLSYNEQIIMLLDVEHTPRINQNNEVLKKPLQAYTSTTKLLITKVNIALIMLNLLSVLVL